MPQSRKAPNKDKDKNFVMVIQGDSYKLAPSLWENCDAKRKPDFVFVDPYGLNDPRGQPTKLLTSLSKEGVPFMCWTPLFQVPKDWELTKWSFESHEATAGNVRVGDKSSKQFVDDCMKKKYHLAWFCWAHSDGSTTNMYGCQLTFGNVFCCSINPADVWEFQSRCLPYLDLNLTILPYSWKTPCAQSSPNPTPAAPSTTQPGVQWWDKYRAAFWWP